MREEKAATIGRRRQTVVNLVQKLEAHADGLAFGGGGRWRRRDGDVDKFAVQPDAPTHVGGKGLSEAGAGAKPDTPDHSDAGKWHGDTRSGASCDHVALKA